jgi:hypothetical protein
VLGKDSSWEELVDGDGMDALKLPAYTKLAHH